ncbi:AAA family ATPase [Enterobacter hormaechei]|uniref:UvrD-helicase domain-containing protein n=1 Tax=Enterobacter hormaechei TaxID=158836 RepID=UPI002162A80C|nr:UvrD-helicase domain-containing protein [Enterobacter hormaechei]MCS0520339.1 AAA family ATPase [Enterobacter hormaechei]HCJ7364472.1 ATP-dependent helicase [Enterobacter hormaechei subsp. xiangfangensis]
MTSRIGSPDTQADIDVRTCLDSSPPRSFVMVAGAGSGKTTSLIKALAHLADTRGSALRRAGQKISCITYTEVAVGEIAADVGNSQLFHISTIHSFLWSVIRPFHLDIAKWVVARIHEKIAEKQAHYDKPRTQAKTKSRLEDEIAYLSAQLECIDDVDKFIYGTGSNYAKGILGHDDILKLVPACVEAHPLLRRIVAKRFPFVFVDESQDTDPDVISALRTIANDNPDMCIGFFGDPMQKIYMSGAGAIPLSDGWAEITKPENFRCPTSVLGVINSIRASGDGLQQIRGRTTIVDGVEQTVSGTVNLFILPSNVERSAYLTSVRRYLANETSDEQWLSDTREGDVRLLVLVHRMAANRLGFPSLFAALTDKAPMSLSEGVNDGSAWPLRPFVQHILPIFAAAQANDQFQIMSIMRSECPKLEPLRLHGQAMVAVLNELQQGIDGLFALLEEGSQATVRDILLHVKDCELLRLDDRFENHLSDEPVNDGNDDFENVQNYLRCNAHELWAYRRYLSEESPFATHHGVKGAQFERVLVVIDDEEARFSQYSYGKYFQYIPLSDNDLANLEEGKESVLDRTRRLFYVCCSRALKDLAVVIFVPDVAVAQAAIVEQNLFPASAILGAHDLG